MELIVQVQTSKKKFGDRKKLEKRVKSLLMNLHTYESEESY